MKKVKIIISSIAVLALSFITNSCKMTERADKHFERFEYTKAIPMYKKVLDTDSTLTDAWAKLGDCYRLNNQTIEAEACYQKVVNDPKSKSLYKLYYAQMLINNTKYAEAERWIEMYKKEEPGDTRAITLERGIYQLDKFLSGKEMYQVQKLNINTNESEYGPVLYKGGILFNSSRESDSWANRQHSWTGKRYYSIYYSKGKEIDFETPVVFLRGLQTKYNNSSVCFNNTGNEMIMTRNNIEDGVVRRSDNHTVKLKLFLSTLNNGQWTDAVPFKYNSDNYSCAHPAISPDGKTLILSSDMPGTLGGMDLWSCTRTKNGWSLPKNLGPNVNTEGNEIFPTFSDNGVIYFSSNGYGGLGGLDIFLTTDSAGNYTYPRNAGFPINSSDDDFGLVWDAKNNIGYLSSNRINQGFNDDIYCLTKSVNLVTHVFDKTSSKPVGSTIVTVIEEGAAPETSEIDKNGNVKKGLNRNKNYKLVIQHENYEPDTILVSKDNFLATSDSMTVNVMLDRAPLTINIAGNITNEATKNNVDSALVLLVNMTSKDTMRAVTGPDGNYLFSNLDTISDYRIIAEGKISLPGIIDTSFRGITESQTIQMDIALYCLDDQNRLTNIYYDLNKSNIRKDAAKELDKLASLMQKYQNIEIELGSHTDSRASYLYNMKLSQARAKAAVEYLVKKGVDKDRMTARGYGESKLVNKCQDEGDTKVFCTEHEHQLNRRTEIIIISREWTATPE